ncbi:Rieske (2Fe-2S) domain protein [Fibrisoma limi BUZ 3]|uniref:Rieske (2Fe-2S) domain protein n=1 Tax=Fibrisoma limi BUZ 3 TaxID=1185876 RepID=I2GTD7_9BACT|nr:Rieske (2Fe-2S) protein [Fibrisoma limi]CCH57166.1 Rieske (2Fe-2S) domain protein [Fibrisoma limi BUZ 3]
MKTKTQPVETIKRGEFLRSLGLSSAALMSFYCMGTLTSCSSSDGDDPTPGGNGNSNTKVDFTLDLTTTANQKLKTDGGFLYQGDVIVARVKGGNYVALSKICTHQGTTIEYRLGDDDFYCPNHGSQFRSNGTVEVGPASQTLKVYKTELSSDGNRLRVTE